MRIGVFFDPGPAGVDVVEGTDAEGDQVGRQRLGLREAHDAAAARRGRLGVDRRVRDGVRARRDRQRQLPGRPCTRARRSTETRAARRSSRAACRRTSRRRPSGGRRPASKSRRSSPCTRRGASSSPAADRLRRRRSRRSRSRPGPCARRRRRPAGVADAFWISSSVAFSQRSSVGSESRTSMSTEPRKVVLVGVDRQRDPVAGRGRAGGKAQFRGLGRPGRPKRAARRARTKSGGERETRRETRDSRMGALLRTHFDRVFIRIREREKFRGRAPKRVASRLDSSARIGDLTRGVDSPAGGAACH